MGTNLITLSTILYRVAKNDGSGHDGNHTHHDRNANGTNNINVSKIFRPKPENEVLSLPTPKNFKGGDPSAPAEDRSLLDHIGNASPLESINALDRDK